MDLRRGLVIFVGIQPGRRVKGEGLREKRGGKIFNTKRG